MFVDQVSLSLSISTMMMKKRKSRLLSLRRNPAASLVWMMMKITVWNEPLDSNAKAKVVILLMTEGEVSKPLLPGTTQVASGAVVVSIN